MDVYGEIAQARRDLADYLDTLDDKAWQTQSLCSEWTVREVAAHLSMPLSTPGPKVLTAIVANGFSFNKANDKLSRARAAKLSPKELAAALRDNAEHRFKPPFLGPEAPLTELTVHGSDIRRPLGQTVPIPKERATAVLDFLAKAPQGFVKKKRLAGLRFEATDVEWSHGEGQLVRGPSEALILALTGRNVALDDLEGDGVATLRSRS
ncbi:MAG: hypothetical protein QOI95_1188 [Acidimicrobiaceae bacterium]|jgi:uncharacterized protein (TIGR03083 family)